jgi:hypothetical protein
MTSGMAVLPFFRKKTIPVPAPEEPRHFFVQGGPSGRDPVCGQPSGLSQCAAQKKGRYIGRFFPHQNSPFSKIRV